MGYVNIAPEKLASAYKFANAFHSDTFRAYANAYISWLRNGSEGLEPKRGRALWKAEIRAKIDAMQLWEGAT